MFILKQCDSVPKVASFSMVTRVEVKVLEVGLLQISVCHTLVNNSPFAERITHENCGISGR